MENNLEHFSLSSFFPLPPPDKIIKIRKSGKNKFHQYKKRHLPLSGVVILDLSRGVPGPYASLILSDMGATVISVSPPISPISEPSLHRGKLRMKMDLKDPLCRRLLLEMLPHVHVLIHSYLPDFLQSVGLTSEILREHAPYLKVIGITGFGPDKPIPSHDLLSSALTGHLTPVFTSSTDSPSHPQYLPPSTYQTTLLGGAYPVVTSILTGFIRTPLYPLESPLWLPPRISTPIYNEYHVAITPNAACSLLPFTDNPLSIALTPNNTTSDFKTSETSHLSNAQHPYYRCYLLKDGHSVAVAAAEPKFQKQLLILLGITLGSENTDNYLKRVEGALSQRFGHMTSTDIREQKDEFEKVCVCLVTTREHLLNQPDLRNQLKMIELEVIDENNNKTMTPGFSTPNYTSYSSNIVWSENHHGDEIKRLFNIPKL